MVDTVECCKNCQFVLGISCLPACCGEVDVELDRRDSLVSVTSSSVLFVRRLSNHEVLQRAPAMLASTACKTLSGFLWAHGWTWPLTVLRQTFVLYHCTDTSPVQLHRTENTFMLRGGCPERTRYKDRTVDHLIIRKWFNSQHAENNFTT